MFNPSNFLGSLQLSPREKGTKNNPQPMKCTPKVGQKTFGVYYVKEETQEAQPIRLSPLYAYDRRWL